MLLQFAYHKYTCLPAVVSTTITFVVLFYRYSSVLFYICQNKSQFLTFSANIGIVKLESRKFISYLLQCNKFIHALVNIACLPVYSYWKSLMDLSQTTLRKLTRCYQTPAQLTFPHPWWLAGAVYWHYSQPWTDWFTTKIVQILIYINNKSKMHYKGDR